MEWDQNWGELFERKDYLSEVWMGSRSAAKRLCSSSSSDEVGKTIAIVSNTSRYSLIGHLVFERTSTISRQFYLNTNIRINIIHMLNRYFHDLR